MSSNIDLLKAGFSVILGVDLSRNECTFQPFGEQKEFTIHDLFKQTYVMRPVIADDFYDGTHLFIQTLTKRYQIPYQSPSCTIEQVKAAIQDKDGVPPDQQRLIYSGLELKDDDKTLNDYGIHPGATVHLVVQLRGGGPGPFYRLASGELHPAFDFDFSDIKDDGKKYLRGGFEYKRPYGWKRIAIKVAGKYESDVWLGPNGIRTYESAKEWPVSYHGTYFSRANEILEKGFKPGDRSLYGSGVYSSPNLEMVENHYAQKFTHQGKTYKIVFQNRVNPDQLHGHLKVISAADTGVDADYWVSPKQDLSSGVYDVRPYGILIKEVNKCQRSSPPTKP